jgi:hypothetical protein
MYISKCESKNGFRNLGRKGAKIGSVLKDKTRKV